MRAWLRIATVVLGLLVVSAGLATVPPTAFEQAMELYNAGDMKAAVEAFRAVLAEEPDHALAKRYLQEALAALEAAGEAETPAEEEVPETVSQPEAGTPASGPEASGGPVPDASEEGLIERARMEAELRARQEAFERRRVYDQLISEADAAMRKADYEAAVDLYEQALDMLPGDEMAAKGLERAQAAAAKEAERRRQYLETRGKQELAAALERGKELMERGLFEEAAVEFRKALLIDPENEEAARLLSDALLPTGEPTEERKVVLARRQAELYLREARALYDDGRFEEAAIQADKAIAAALPGEPVYAQAQWLRGEIRAAQAAYERARAEEARRLEALRQLSMVDEAWGNLGQLGEGAVEARAEKAVVTEGQDPRYEAAKRVMIKPSFTDAHIRHVLMFIHQVSGLNIVLDEGALQREEAGMPLAAVAGPVAPAPGGFGVEAPGFGPPAPGVVSSGAPVDPTVTFEYVSEVPVTAVLDAVTTGKGLLVSTVDLPSNIVIKGKGAVSREPLEFRVFPYQAGTGETVQYKSIQSLEDLDLGETSRR